MAWWQIFNMNFLWSSHTYFRFSFRGSGEEKEKKNTQRTPSHLLSFVWIFFFVCCCSICIHFIYLCYRSHYNIAMHGAKVHDSWHCSYLCKCVVVVIVSHRIGFHVFRCCVQNIKDSVFVLPFRASKSIIWHFSKGEKMITNSYLLLQLFK